MADKPQEQMVKELYQAIVAYKQAKKATGKALERKT